jgi:SNF2 family DNA or RNA helicase
MYTRTISCVTLINYDLPWNSIRVRTADWRIDRIGQLNEEVKILNYSYEETVETDIYDRLEDRNDLFENAVGEMQPFLSGEPTDTSGTLNADPEAAKRL